MTMELKSDRKVDWAKPAGRTLRAIAAGLVADGVPTARGGAWHAGTVKAVCASVALDALAVVA